MANNIILEKLEGVKSHFVEIGELLTLPDILSDMKKYVRLNKEYKELLPVVESYERYKLALSNLTSAKQILATEKDEELRDMAKAEVDDLSEKLPGMEEEIKILLIPADPEDGKNAVMEIRAGTGGDEASIFAGDLFRMYSKFFESRGWKAEVTNVSEGTAGG
jgi:peptide chain release factor 1